MLYVDDSCPEEGCINIQGFVEGMRLLTIPHISSSAEVLYGKTLDELLSEGMVINLNIVKSRGTYEGSLCVGTAGDIMISRVNDLYPSDENKIEAVRDIFNDEPTLTTNKQEETK